MPSSDPAGTTLFFTSIINESLHFIEELRGVRQFRLSDLQNYPTDKLNLIVPIIKEGVRVSMQDNQVVAVSESSSDVVELFEVNDENTFVFNRFNGENSIGRIAFELREVFDLPRDPAFERVRKLFLHLVHLGICIPNNPVEA